jgi:hypothetical protein
VALAGAIPAAALVVLALKVTVLPGTTVPPEVFSVTVIVPVLPTAILVELAVTVDAEALTVPPPLAP